VPDNGTDSIVYEEAIVSESDYVLLIRPPLLWLDNVQPKHVVVWDCTSIGFHPYNCDAYHVDFNGDEGHIYPISSIGLVEEIMRWLRVLSTQLEEWLEMDAIPDEWNIQSYRINAIQTMQTTTMSIQQIVEGHIKAYGWDKYGIKAGLVGQFASRHCNMAIPHMFVEECVRSMHDIMLQQTTQGSIEHMTKITRLYGLCFSMTSIGRLQASRLDCTTKHDIGTYSLVECLEYEGSGALRTIESITSAAQQEALDTHKVRLGTGNTPPLASRLDMIQHIFQGTTKDCLIMLSRPYEVPTK